VFRISLATQFSVTISLPPFQGGPVLDGYQGLKPLAESLRPFGTRSSPIRTRNLELRTSNFEPLHRPFGTRSSPIRIRNLELRTSNFEPLYRPFGTKFGRLVPHELLAPRSCYRPERPRDCPGPGIAARLAHGRDAWDELGSAGGG
jgi:hypothetical protein